MGRGGEADPRRDIGDECGWPKSPDPNLLKYLYDSDAIAARVVEVMAKETWQVTLKISGGAAFDKSLDDVRAGLGDGEENYTLADDNSGDPLSDVFFRADALSGIGSYGGIYLALDDGLDPAQPAGGITEEGSAPVATPGLKNAPKFSTNGNGVANYRHTVTRNAEQVAGRRVVGMLPLAETQARVLAWEGNRNSQRFGWPVSYQVYTIDPDMYWSGAMPTVQTMTVHWTRLVHVADIYHHPSASEAVAYPRLRAVLPEVLDGRKISGADAEAFYRNAFLKLFFETHPQLGGDVLVDDEQLRDMMEQMDNGSQRHGRLSGMSANSVAPTVVDATPHQDAKIARICIKLGIPKRVFMGSERGELASGQDEDQHSDNVRGRQTRYAGPRVAGRTVNRLIYVGACAPPTDNRGKVKYEWPDIAKQDDETKAKVFATRMQGATAAIGGGVPDLLGEETFLTEEMGYTEEQARKMIAEKDKALLEQEQADADLAEEHGMVPTPPVGFQHTPPPPEPPGPVKVKPGEKLVFPRGGER